MFFVTGSSGFIGKQLVEKIDGEIRVLSRKPHPHYETIVCDLASDIIPRASIDGVDTIFHLAGVKHDKTNAAKIESHYAKVNVDATVRLAELAIASGVKRFIFLSSVKAVPQWSVPRVIFTIASHLSSNLHYKVNKLLDDEYYSSEKLQSLGFKAQRSLREMNETAF